jgi:hypothetical protein
VRQSSTEGGRGSSNEGRDGGKNPSTARVWNEPPTLCAGRQRSALFLATAGNAPRVKERGGVPYFICSRCAAGLGSHEGALKFRGTNRREISQTIVQKNHDRRVCPSRRDHDVGKAVPVYVTRCNLQPATRRRYSHGFRGTAAKFKCNPVARVARTTLADLHAREIGSAISIKIRNGKMRRRLRRSRRGRRWSR